MAPHTGGGAGVSRRGVLLTGLAAAAGGAGAALGGRELLGSTGGAPAASAPQAADARAEAFHGPHQAGIATPAQAHALFCAFDLRDDVGLDGLRRLMRILTDDITRVMSGRPALGDTAPELAADPSRLTVTVGFGPSLFDRIERPDLRPPGLIDLPPFPQIDRLDPALGGADLLLQICCDDPLTAAHAQRMLLKDTRAFAAPAWFQRGFINARGSAPGRTGRNLMGQIDGTVNPGTTSQLDELVWMPGPGWWAGGTTLVIRRIRMELDTWDELDRAAMEAVIGRTLATGAALGAERESDPPDLDAVDATGLKAIADFAHIRRARGAATGPQLLRRPYNYDDSPAGDGTSNLGQIFCSYQADIGAQFVPVQSRLAEQDLLNQWTVPVGSATFLILPGCRPGGYLADGLLG